MHELKISEKEKFLVGSVDILQSNINSDFQENVLKEYFKYGDGSGFDIFIQKTLNFLDRPPFESSHCLFCLKVILSVSVHTNC